MAFRTRAAIAGLTLALVIGAAAPANAASSAAVSASIAPEGYARITFVFDRLPKPSVRIANSVLIIGFDEQVALETEGLARGLGTLASVIRRDPDGTSIRIALQRQVKLVTNEAGENLIVDLLPLSWSALPPPLPADIIAKLSRDARAGRELRAEEARRTARPLARLTLEGATHPTFNRLVFGLGGDVDVDYRRLGDVIRVRLAAPYRFDAAAARALLPADFAGLTGEKLGDAYVVRVPAKGAGEVRGFREGDDFILDLDRASTAGDPHAANEEASPTLTFASISADDAHSAIAEAAHPKPAMVEVSDATPAAADAHSDPARHDAPAAPTPMPSAAAPQATPGVVEVKRAGHTVRLVFPLARPAPAAIFRRGQTLWAVFDDVAPLDLSAITRESGGLVAGADQTPLDRGRAVRMKLSHDRLLSVQADGANWIVSLGDDVLARSDTVDLKPSFDREGRAAMQADAPGLGSVRTIADPDVGDELTVATLAGPARGSDRPRSFVEFQTLATAHGLAFLLGADDARVIGRLDQLFVERDGGLTLSSATAEAASRKVSGGGTVLAEDRWTENLARPFTERENELLGAAAMAAIEDRQEARLDLAGFYLARKRPADAKAVLDAIVEDGGLSERDERLSIMRAAAEIGLGRGQSARAILAAPSLRLSSEASLWRGAAEAADGQTGPARVSLKRGEPALAGLPPDLQARFVGLDVTLALDAGDAATAAAEFDKLDVLPAVDGVAQRDLTRARLAEGLGQTDRALVAYGMLAKRDGSAPGAEAELRLVELGLKAGKLAAPDAIGRLERLTTGWRGDWIEAQALSRLIQLYADAGRWRDAFSTLRVAVQAFPDADGTRSLQDTMQERFTDLFLGAGAETLPKLDALALFYDFKEMSPGGKRGDELVRRLADKLVEVDLFDQAADLLGYQIDNRLQGAARAQVAARAALVDMMNGKPGKALEVLRKTRQADLPGSLMRTRLRLEARALADTGRVDLALEIAEGLEGPEASRLKADILWAARRWPEAGEALETALGTSWRAPGPLDAGQRGDVMRAAIALSLAEDGLGVDRLRQKFAAKMADSPQASAFEVVTAPVEARGDAFREIARTVAASASFDAFMKEYRARGAEEAATSAPNEPQPPKA